MAIYNKSVELAREKRKYHASIQSLYSIKDMWHVFFDILQDSGKVKPGQIVNVRLNNYQDQEFGYIKGIVKSMSPVPTAEGTYIVDIAFPQG